MMLDRNPSEIGFDRKALVDAIDMCTSCAQACTACADACLAEDDRSLRCCVTSCSSCADLCDATGRILSRQTAPNVAIVRAAVEACIASCSACSSECESHDYQHCKTCAEACGRCAEVCRDFLGKLPAVSA
jgi:hypothetical protein